MTKTLPHTEHSENHSNKTENVWIEYDDEFANIISPLSADLQLEKITAEDAATKFNSMLTKYLETKPNLVKEVKTFFKHNPKSLKNIIHAKKLKIDLEKKARQNGATEEDKSQACQALRHYAFLQKEQQSKSESNKIKEQEKAYSKDFHKFAKQVTSGTYGKPPVVPTYSREEANIHYTEKYATEVTIDFSKLDWFPEVSPPNTPYNLAPYTPEDIKQALAKKCPTSAPGDDQILYGYLEKLPQIHKFLATLFTLIRDTSQAPDIWAMSKIILLPKSDNTDPNVPSDFRMIALTANVAKLFHSLESSRTISFMITNGYLDPSAQKAYIQGINGCVEHVQVVQEVINHAKANHRTVNLTWFDLIDAFGSLSHVLVPHVLRHYNIPEIIVNYTSHIYSKLKGKVVTPNWESDVFDFRRGTFQGDPFSGTIFLVTFNPIIEYIKKFKAKQGYKIKGPDENTPSPTHIITTPFADDFNLISRDKKLHQNLISEIIKKTKSMGLSFKPSKCRSLSICSGQAKSVTFVMTNSAGKEIHIDTVHQRPMKFLGSNISHVNSPYEYFDQLHKTLSEKLDNIDNSKVRGEHKLAVYELYTLPSMRYHFSIHDLHKTHLDKLDNLSRKHIKKWLNIQTRGVTDVGIFHPYLMGVKQPSQLYLEGHTSNMLLMRLKGDKTVNSCINSKVDRESKWKKKSSTTIKSDHIVAQVVGEELTPRGSYRNTCENIQKGKVAVKKAINKEIKDKWNEKVRALTMQGDFARLLIEEQESVTWKSVVRQMPRNVMAFATKLTTNSLASPDNLCRWGKRKFGSCPICSSPSCTLAHITNFCPLALNQGRFTWRHDSVLHHILSVVKTLATEGTQVLADLPGYQINGGTIPADILVSIGKGSRPDLVILDRNLKKIALIELTIPLQRNTEKAHARKTLAYTELQIALQEKGYQCILTPFEVGSSGHITRKNKLTLENTLRKFNIRIKKGTFVNMAKISLLCTMSIFYAYQVKEWVSPPLLSP